jgi:hypothetical protein
VPMIISVPEITAKLRDGDWIEMDGGAGTITLLPREKGEKPAHA